jgi:ABC-type branched-subunit amino acid transport system permease subunit
MILSNRLLLIGTTGVVLLIALPQSVELFSLLQITLYCVLAILAISLALIWGYAGILCFGQSAFFGLGAYVYAVGAIDIGESSAPILLAALLPAAVAAALGYFMFYAKITDVYVGVITLTITLILYHCVNATSGPQYHIGEAQLGGFNGMPNVPSINIPFNPDLVLTPEQMFYVSGGSLLGVYFIISWILETRFGRVLVAIRENEERAGFLGYDVRLYKLSAFSIGGGIAGFAGALFASWGNFVSPTTFALAQSAQIIIWLMVGGIGTLLGPVVSCFAISAITAALGTQQIIGANVALGGILLGCVLLMPHGIAPLITSKFLPALGTILRLRTTSAGAQKEDQT